MELKQLLKKVRQELPKADVKITHRANPTAVRYEFLKKINEICLENSHGKVAFKFDKENERVIELLCQHVNNEEQFEKDGRSLKKGIWLYGNFGSGKTILMQAYADIKKRLGVRVGFIACNDLNVKYMESDPFTGKQKRYEGIMNFTAKKSTAEWIFDDLGEEEITINDYGNKISIMAYVFGERYKNRATGGLSHVTTNLDVEEVEHDYGGRIGSRTFEMFNMIKLGANANSIDYRKIKQNESKK